MMYLKYLKYVLKHRWYTIVECSKFGPHALWRGINHDASKFSFDEFFPYAHYFYGFGKMRLKGKEEECRRKFDLAWLHHQQRNPHHWQYWILTRDTGEHIALEMPKIYVVEMVCDWAACGRALGKGNDVNDWFTRNYGRIILHANTRVLVQDLLDQRADKRNAKQNTYLRSDAFGNKID